jgi:hypothetical protein
MTEKEKKNFQNWLTQKGVNPVCPACGKQDWHGGEQLSVPIHRPREDTKAKGGKIFISVKLLKQMICSNCRHVMLFDLPSPAAKPKPPDA